MTRDLCRRARRAASCSVDDGMQERGGKKEGKLIFPRQKVCLFLQQLALCAQEELTDLVEVVYAPLPRPGIDEEALDFEGGGVGVGGFSTLITR